MGLRQNQARLSPTARADFVTAVKKLKSNGTYDQFVAEHRHAFEYNPTPAHNGPGFLPWHREFLLRFEIALQQINPSVNLPYWDWTVDNQKTSKIWDPDFMGGDGAGQNAHDRVTTGPFTSEKGWNLTILPQNPHETDNFLKRALGRSGQFPSQAKVDTALSYAPYDEDPWNSVPARPMTEWRFRKNMEFFIHIPAHDWVGGSMNTSCSPNDPVFWLHHCNIDRLWARWQKELMPGWPYLPPSGTDDVWPGHCLDDAMMTPRQGGTLSPTPHSVLNHHALGYRYDTEATVQSHSSISWEMGSYWRCYGCSTDSFVWEQVCNNYAVGQWTRLDLPVPGNLVSAILLPGATRNPPIRIYVAQPGVGICEYSWNGSAPWAKGNTWNLGAIPVTALAAVSWQNGTHIRVYVGIGQTIKQYCWDSGSGWTEGAVLYFTLLSAISWEDSNKVPHIRIHGLNGQGMVRVLASSDGKTYSEEQLP
jgi:hypothetical protein